MGMTSVSEVESVFEEVVGDVIASDGNSVSSRSEVNDGFCSIVAAEVYERLGEPEEMQLCVESGGGAGGEHYWIEYEGLFYDAERPEGVEDWRDLPYWKRHETPSGFEYDLWVKHTGVRE